LRGSPPGSPATRPSAQFPRAPAAAAPGSTRAAPSSPPRPSTARSPGGASRSSATGRGGGQLPSPTRRRGPLHARHCDLKRQSDRDIKVGRGGLTPLAPTRTSVLNSLPGCSPDIHGVAGSRRALTWRAQHRSAARVGHGLCRLPHRPAEPDADLARAPGPRALQRLQPRHGARPARPVGHHPRGPAPNDPRDLRASSAPRRHAPPLAPRRRRRPGAPRRAVGEHRTAGPPRRRPASRAAPTVHARILRPSPSRAGAGGPRANPWRGSRAWEPAARAPDRWQRQHRPRQGTRRAS